MKPFSLAIALFFLLGANPLFSQESQPAVAAVTEPTAAEDDETLRDPFWPPDYSPVPVVAVTPGIVVPAATNVDTSTQAPSHTPTPPTAVQPKWPVLKLKGIINAGGTYLANIEGIPGVVEKGQEIRIKKDGVLYIWKVSEITDKGVKYTPIDAKPMR